MKALYLTACAFCLFAAPATAQNINDILARGWQPSPYYQPAPPPQYYQPPPPNPWIQPPSIYGSPNDPTWISRDHNGNTTISGGGQPPRFCQTIGRNTVCN